jgi:hypothetical protein
MKRKAEVVMDNVSVDKKVNEDDIRAKLNELHYGFTCSSEAEARFLVLYEPFILTPNFTTDILFCPSTNSPPVSYERRVQRQRQSWQVASFQNPKPLLF